MEFLRSSSDVISEGVVNLGIILVLREIRYSEIKHLQTFPSSFVHTSPLR